MRNKIVYSDLWNESQVMSVEDCWKQYDISITTPHESVTVYPNLFCEGYNRRTPNLRRSVERPNELRPVIDADQYLITGLREEGTSQVSRTFSIHPFYQESRSRVKISQDSPHTLTFKLSKRSTPIGKMSPIFTFNLSFPEGSSIEIKDTKS